MRCFAIFEPETQAQICIFYKYCEYNYAISTTEKAQYFIALKDGQSAYNYYEAIVKVTTQHMLDIGDTKLEENDDTATGGH